jgi:hypothetical protein
MKELRRSLLKQETHDDQGAPYIPDIETIWKEAKKIRTSLSFKQQLERLRVDERPEPVELKTVKDPSPNFSKYLSND